MQPDKFLEILMHVSMSQVLHINQRQYGIMYHFCKPRSLTKYEYVAFSFKFRSKNFNFSFHSSLSYASKNLDKILHYKLKKKKKKKKKKKNFSCKKYLNWVKSRLIRGNLLHKFKPITYFTIIKLSEF